MSSTAMPWDALEGLATRTPRKLETRETTQRPVTYLPPSMLPDPTPRDGIAFRWVRSSSRGVDDKVHFNKRSREGYTPVMAEQHPELMAEIGLTNQSGIVEVGGLILCQIDEARVTARERYYRNRNAAEMDAADNQYLRDSDPRMKKTVERKTSFGRSLA